MDYSQVGIALAQILVFLVNALIYARQKSALDVEKRDRGVFGTKVSDVERVARDASSAISSLTFTHYESLRQTVEALSHRVRELESENLSLKESVASLSNKLASRDRADSSKINRAIKEALTSTSPVGEEVDDAPRVPGKDPLADLIASGQAIPLGPQSGPAEKPVNHFGRSAVR